MSRRADLNQMNLALALSMSLNAQEQASSLSANAASQSKTINKSNNFNKPSLSPNNTLNHHAANAAPMMQQPNQKRVKTTNNTATSFSSSSSSSTSFDAKANAKAKAKMPISYKDDTPKTTYSGSTSKKAKPKTGKNTYKNNNYTSNYTSNVSLVDSSKYLSIQGTLITPKNLSQAVETFGGIEAVMVQRKWQQVLKHMNLQQGKNGSGGQMKNLYKSYFGLPDHLLYSDRGGHFHALGSTNHNNIVMGKQNKRARGGALSNTFNKKKKTNVSKKSSFSSTNSSSMSSSSLSLSTFDNKKRKRTNSNSSNSSNKSDFILPPGWRLETKGPYADGRIHNEWFNPQNKKFRSVVEIRRFLGQDVKLRKRSSSSTSSSSVTSSSTPGVIQSEASMIEAAEMKLDEQLSALRDEHLKKRERLAVTQSKDMETVLKRLKRSDLYGHFLEPVDPENDSEYYKEIIHPMDLATMLKKLHEQKYAKNHSEIDANGAMDWEKFRTDISHICQNAIHYNELEEVRGKYIFSLTTFTNNSLSKKKETKILLICKYLVY